MAASGLLELDAGSAREVFGLSKEERAASRTHFCLHAARLVFLVSHGLLVLVVSVSLEHLDEADWSLIFLPVWVGDAVSMILIAVSWFASCTYIKQCLAERQPRLNDSPSILTEVLPEIVLTVPGLVFLLLVFCSEYSLCVFLSSSQQGRPRALPAATTLLVIVALLSLCQGALFLPNTSFWLSTGAGLLLFAISFAATQQPDCSAIAQAFAVLPFVLSVAGLLLASIWRMRKYASVLRPEERVLLSVEAILLALLLLMLLGLAHQISREKLREAGPVGCAAGTILCLLALPRARLALLQARIGHLEDRPFCSQAETITSASSSEVQIGMTDSAVTMTRESLASSC
mmetsp:Transcript_59095/g.105064  ORF Transcript_59095/g.105064 Transcript_59095/m.105064 type:complete len:346 (+) Transcript_59095:65-1102(+)